MSQKYAGAARPAHAPKQPLPPKSCDCHLHVFGDPARYPDRHPNPVHKSLEATWEDALAMHRTVGFERGVYGVGMAGRVARRVSEDMQVAVAALRWQWLLGGVRRPGRAGIFLRHGSSRDRARLYLNSLRCQSGTGV